MACAREVGGKPAHTYVRNGLHVLSDDDDEEVGG